ncbi:MAG: DUF370 domain-containing protein [Anaerolineae bacterium]|nr:DUF370 domain-containing protein [Anaerolineae bacterium]
MTKLVLFGRGGAVAVDRVVAVARASSAPVKRLLQAAGPARVLSLTYGEPRQSVILLDNGCLVVVSLSIDEVLDKLRDAQTVEGMVYVPISS